jgi:predicted glycoside hydrolase/deacetylase ChbG (UPF0249 family)
MIKKGKSMKHLKFLLKVFLTCAIGILISCTETDDTSGDTQKKITWGEKLGFPKDKRVLILHADDAGMCDEANISTFNYLEQDQIQSTAVMVPCEWFDEFAQWNSNHPDKDVGLHLTLTSEWQEYRWGSVAGAEEVPGLIDPDGFLWHSVPEVVGHASPDEVEKEIRAQIEKAIEAGIQPDHIDTHMGTLFGSVEFMKVYIKVAEEYSIPAMVIELSDKSVADRFRQQGYPLNEKALSTLADYKMPKLDDFHAAPGGSTYEEKRQNFFDLVKSLNPGITEIIFHPSVETENLKQITNSWQQRVWEAQMFSDPDVIQFFKDEGVIFTNWIEMKERYN